MVMLARRPTLPCLTWLALWLASLPALVSAAQVRDVRLWSGPEGTRLVVELTAPVEYDVFALDNPDRIVVDLADTTLPARKVLPSGQGPSIVGTAPRWHKARLPSAIRARHHGRFVPGPGGAG